MRARILDFVQALRARGVDVSVAEALDGVRAVGAAGVERDVLREALATTLVKDETDRSAFDALFDEMFPLIGAGEERGRRRRRAPRPAGDVPAAGRGQGEGRGREPRTDTKKRGERETRRERMQRLVRLPFREFTSRDVEEARALVRELGRRLRGRLARRARPARGGRLDFRRTIRAAIPTGGTPVRPRWRARRPGRPDLVALCDLSGSVAAASELLLGLVAPAADYFRRTHLFAYVDRLCPVSIENGHVAPGGPLDLHGRSDFGRVLLDLWEGQRAALTGSTLLLILGDARNNRLPPRADVLRAIAERVQRVVWLVPEPRARWDSGDSVLHLYAPACDAVVECLDLAALVRAVQIALTRPGP